MAVLASDEFITSIRTEFGEQVAGDTMRDKNLMEIQTLIPRATISNPSAPHRPRARASLCRRVRRRDAVRAGPHCIHALAILAMTSNRVNV